MSMTTLEIKAWLCYLLSFSTSKAPTERRKEAIDANRQFCHPSPSFFSFCVGHFLLDSFCHHAAQNFLFDPQPNSLSFSFNRKKKKAAAKLVCMHILPKAFKATIAKEEKKRTRIKKKPVYIKNRVGPRPPFLNLYIWSNIVSEAKMAVMAWLYSLSTQKPQPFSFPLLKPLIEFLFL